MCKHTWIETGKKSKHVEGPLFKYGTPVVTYLRCKKCGQLGYIKPPSRVIYTWKQDTRSNSNKNYLSQAGIQEP